MEFVPQLQSMMSCTDVDNDPDVPSTMKSNIYHYSTDSMQMCLQRGLPQNTRIRQIATGDLHVIALTQGFELYIDQVSDIFNWSQFYNMYYSKINLFTLSV